MLPALQTSDLLRKIPILAGLSDEDLALLAIQCRSCHFAHDEVIFFQGDPAERLWILRQGQVKIVHHEIDGREVILELIPPGEPFGGATIFLAEQPGTAQAVTDVETLCLPAEAYTEFIRGHPDLALRLIQLLGRRIHSIMELHILAGERVERRLAHILLKLADRAGRIGPDGLLITIPFSRQDLADMSGTTLETAIRICSRFNSQGILKTLRGGYILITDEPALRRLAGE